MKKRKQYCIFYAAGPGDVVETFSCSERNKEDYHQTASTYSGQFLDLCRKKGLRGVLVSSAPGAAMLKTKQFHVENLPQGTLGGKVGFHLSRFLYSLSIIRRALKEKADMLVVSDSTGHWFPFSWFVPAAMTVVPVLHCMPWPKFRPVSFFQGVLNRLNRRLFQHRAGAVMGVSHEVHGQLKALARGGLRPFFPFIPTYGRQTFAEMPAPPGEGPFQLLYVGRLESEKGIFDLLDLFRLLKQSGEKRIVLHVCGDGSREAELAERVEAAGLSKMITLHGYCRREKLRKLVEGSHAFIVPTPVGPGEGFNKVVAEAVLSGRPVIATTVCPAVSYVPGAACPVSPGDIPGFARALRRLAHDRGYYEEKREACIVHQGQFYDTERSWGAALGRIVDLAVPGNRGGSGTYY